LLTRGLLLVAFDFFSPACDISKEAKDRQQKVNEKIDSMKDTITVYEKPTCTKCREMNKFLTENGVDFMKVNYYIEPLSKEKLTELLGKMKLSPRDLLRKSEPVYRELGLAKGAFSDNDIVALMVEHPDLIQRPIIERGDRAVLGRPTENVKELL
jgi:arsenate reductase